ncbi:glutaminase domain-containing protein [Bacteroides reticulotermitis]|uniref:glutaminase domain-containing protein n=1 Tax=Bacteroides reticulotermitis TaxID=1133319 RepID=UPI003A874A48
MKQQLMMLLLGTASVFCSCSPGVEQHDKNELRAPAYPLVTIDPYTSAWSFTDKLYDGSVRHWTGKEFPLIGVAKVDGQTYRFLGTEELELRPLVKTSEQGSWIGKYTTQQPADGWQNAGFEDAAWKEGEGAFGTKENEPTAKTQWGEEYIWVRRTADIQEDLTGKSIYLEYSHDDDVTIYINGIKVVDTGNACNKNVLLKLSDEVVASLKPGDNLIAAYCHNRVGNGLLDFGLLVELEDNRYFFQTAEQTSVEVQPTQTYYEFTCGPVDLKLKFTAPLLPTDLDLISMPVNYISYEVSSNDGQKHQVELYFEASPQWALDLPHQESIADSFTDGNLLFLRTGSRNQEILKKKGDNVRIDWGHFYLAAEKENTISAIGDGKLLRKSFVENKLEAPATNGYDKLALVHSLGETKKADGYLLIGYDDIYSIQYFEENLRPYWNRTGDETIVTQFHKAEKEHKTLMESCAAFDRKMMEEATAAGGRKYAELCALAYRQAMAAHKLVQAPNGDLLFLSKENFSNGSIGTVDITYPSSPMFLYYNPELAKGLLNHIFYYSESGKWTKPFAAHDVGTYPLANGQTYGGDMPIEESGNMLVVTAAIAAVEGNANYALKHWKTLTTWTDYLVEHGLDPDTQLCTDDFAGHFAHNANLSIKAILGIASYGYLAEQLGKKDVAEKYTQKAREMANEWVSMADDGDHYRLTFDKPGTWSQKYNLVWDKLMKLQIFPEKVAETEIAYYLTKQNKYGLPLDNRETYTKLDWIMWTATLAKDKATFERFIEPVYLFVNETPHRVPMSDWVFTDSPNQRGFQARSVVGGYFIKMLEDKLTK